MFAALRHPCYGYLVPPCPPVGWGRPYADGDCGPPDCGSRGLSVDVLSPRFQALDAESLTHSAVLILRKPAVG